MSDKNLHLQRFILSLLHILSRFALSSWRLIRASEPTEPVQRYFNSDIPDENHIQIYTGLVVERAIGNRW